MMTRSKKLQPVADLARQNERTAARQHGDVLRELQQHENQLNELLNYRQQYLTALNTAGQTGLSAVQLQDYRLFIKRLDIAINQQQQNVNLERQNCEFSQNSWMDKRNRSKMINKVVSSRQKTESQEQEKQEQRELEDRPSGKGPGNGLS